MITALQNAVESIESTLPDLGLSLAPNKTEFLSVFGRNPAPDFSQPCIIVGTTPIPAKLDHIRLLGIPSTFDSTCHTKTI